MNIVHQLKADIGKLNSAQKTPSLKLIEAASHLETLCAILGYPEPPELTANERSVEELIKDSQFIMQSAVFSTNKIAKGNADAVYTKLCDFKAGIEYQEKKARLAAEKKESTPQPPKGGEASAPQAPKGGKVKPAATGNFEIPLADGKVLELETKKAEVKEGVNVRINGTLSPDASYTLPDGTAITVQAGKITEVILPK